MDNVKPKTVECNIFLDQLEENHMNSSKIFTCSLKSTNLINYPNYEIEVVNKNQEEIESQINDNHIISFIKDDNYIQQYILLLMSDLDYDYSSCEKFNNDLLKQNGVNTSDLNINGLINKNLENNLNIYLEQISENQFNIHLGYNIFMYYAKEGEITTQNIKNPDVIKSFIHTIIENGLFETNDISSSTIKELFDITID